MTSGSPQPSDSELVLGLVAPAGTNLDSVEADLRSILAGFGYRTETVRLSELALQLTGAPRSFPSEYQRLSACMDAGNRVRCQADGEALALAAAADISDRRVKVSDNPEPKRRTAHIIRSLTHPDEVLRLRRLYGPGFFAIGIVAAEADRRRYLESIKNCTAPEATEILRRDEDEGGRGQRTRATFHLADAFVRVGQKCDLDRIVGLIFGQPFTTPRLDEHSMFLAFAAAARSGDLSRQVGAVITSAEGDVLATGANDVPKPSGGLYWPGAEDRRDHALGYDSNERQREQIMHDILDKLSPLMDGEKWRAAALEKLQKAALMDITEYGRAVHAEMDALLSCGRSGRSARGGVLYSTTFPCHNCAKHIVAAGITRVVYVEPYPKSKAAEFYADSIEVAPTHADGRRVVFEPFEGVGPRRFFDLFSVALSSGYPLKRKSEGGRIREDWKPETAEVRVPLPASTYLVGETAAMRELASRLKGSKS
jgi:deoxycytidylate deaminase